MKIKSYTIKKRADPKITWLYSILLQGFFNENLDGSGMDSDDPFSGLGGGGLGSGLGASFGQGRTPFRSVLKNTTNVRQLLAECFFFKYPC